MDKYIGLDVHATSCTAAIVDARGKRLGHHVLETNGQVLVEFFKTLKGALHVCMEEGTQAGWLVEILSAHVERVVTLRVPESRGAKSDERDAFGLAERLRTGAIDAGVYKQVGPFATLRQLVKAHQIIVRDVARTKNRIKAVFRSRGVSVVGKAVYSPAKRDEYLRQLPASSRAASRASKGVEARKGWDATETALWADRGRAVPGETPTNLAFDALFNWLKGSPDSYLDATNEVFPFAVSKSFFERMFPECFSARRCTPASGAACKALYRASRASRVSSRPSFSRAGSRASSIRSLTGTVDSFHHDARALRLRAGE